MILKVFTDERYEQPTIIPITPNTKFSDVIACCRESGRSQCHLVEIWKGRERVVGYDERPFESIIQRGIGQDEIWFSLRPSALSGGENRFRDKNKSNHMPTSNRQITSNSNHHRESDMTLTELQDLASRQQQQLEEQQQLIVAREQRLKYLKQQEQRRQQTNNQNATLQTLLQHVYTQEQKLQQLRMSRGEAFQQVSFNNYWAAELDSLRELFKQKEKELAHVVDRVDILSKNLDSVVQKNVCSQENGASKNQTELGRLCAEVTYQNKRNEEQNSIIKSQQEILLQRTDEMTRINAKVDDLRARLNLKRPDNSAAKELQLVGTGRGKSLNSAVATVGPFVQQASFREGDQRFTKVDSKYQSLPLGGRVTSGPERLSRGSEMVEGSEGVSQNRLAQNEMKVSQPGNNRVVENSSANSSTSMNSNVVNGSRSWEFMSRTLPSEASRISNNEIKSGRTHSSSSNAETSPADDSKTGFRSADSLGYYSTKHSETNSSFTLSSPSLTLVSDRSMSSVTNSSFPNSPSPNVLSPKLFIDSTMESCSPISADPPTMYYKMPVEKGPILKMATTTPSSDYPLTRYMPPFTATIIMPSTNTTTSASSSIRSTESRHRLEHGTGNNSYGNRQLENNPSLTATSSYSQKATGRAPLSTTVSSDEMQSTRYNNLSSEAAKTMHIPLSHKSGDGSTRNGSMLKSDPYDNDVHGSNNISGMNEETKNKDGNNNGSRSAPIMFSPTALVRPLPPQTIVETNRTSTETDYKVTTAYRNPGLNAVVTSNTKRYSMASPTSTHWTDSSSQYFQSPRAETPEVEVEKSKFTAEQISASEQALDQLDGSLLMRHNAEKTSGPRPLRRRLSSSETNEETHKPLKWQMNRNSSDSVLTRKSNEPSSSAKLNVLPSDRLVSTILGFSLSPLSSKISSLVETTHAVPSSSPPSNPSRPFSDGLASTSSTNQMPSDTVISECSISPQPPAPPSSVVSDSTMDDEHKNGDLFRNDVDGDDLEVTEEDQPLEGEPEPILIYVSPVKNAKKSNLKKDQSKKTTNSVRFDPLTLLLDASLQGELDTVQDAIARVPDPSISNDEGITALHNAICGGHFEIVKFLVDYGCDVNAADSDHWTPLHCAASCNNLEIVKLLVENGACVFATTESDNEMAVEKCEEEEEGYDSCLQYLKSIEEKMGSKEHPNVYAVFDYESSSADELSFSCGDRLTVLKRGDDSEEGWWWARRDDKEGYIPRNYFGAHPRILTIR